MVGKEQRKSINPFAKIAAKPRHIKSLSDIIWVFHFTSVFDIPGINSCNHKNGPKKATRSR
ncbi:MAG: cytochrome P450, partial [Deltaproteobacteria bacterium]|nr:cytochrome P450 [Deltaproteobacteria bacterium]